MSAKISVLRNWSKGDVAEPLNKQKLKRLHRSVLFIYFNNDKCCHKMTITISDANKTITNKLLQKPEQLPPIFVKKNLPRKSPPKKLQKNAPQQRRFLNSKKRETLSFKVS